MKLRYLLGTISLTVCTVSVGQAPAPLIGFNPPVELSEYFPRQSLRYGLMARVEITFRPSLYSHNVRPLSLSLSNVEIAYAPAGGEISEPKEKYQEPFIAAAARLVDRIRLTESAKEEKLMRVSVLFLVPPCNQMKHEPKVDYYITVCKGPEVRRDLGSVYE